MPGALIASETASDQAASRYVSSDVGQRMLDQMFSPQGITSRAHVLAVLRKKSPDEHLERRVKTELAHVRPVLEANAVKTLSELFTTAEIEALERFQRTPAGAAVLDKFPILKQRIAARTQPLIGDLKERLVEDLEDIR